jgi:hypothetical protein
MQHDRSNQWFCFLTDSCAPLVSPAAFRQRFFAHYQDTFLAWKPAWWDVYWIRRANLHRLPTEFRLANTPWFILQRADAARCLQWVRKHTSTARTIMDGPVANESLFAIVLHATHRLPHVRNEETTLADWSRMPNAMSPYSFEDMSDENRHFLETRKSKSTLFVRKIGAQFPMEQCVDLSEPRIWMAFWREVIVFVWEWVRFVFSL